MITHKKKEPPIGANRNGGKENDFIKLYRQKKSLSRGSNYD